MTERDEYTPSVDRAADLYVRAREQPAHDAGHLPAKYPDEYRAEFDRMIEAVRAEEREKAAQIAETASGWETFTASDGHKSIAQHGVPMPQYIAARIREGKERDR